MCVWLRWDLQRNVALGSRYSDIFLNLFLKYTLFKFASLWPCPCVWDFYYQITLYGHGIFRIWCSQCRFASVTFNRPWFVNSGLNSPFLFIWGKTSFRCIQKKIYSDPLDGVCGIKHQAKSIFFILRPCYVISRFCSLYIFCHSKSDKNFKWSHAINSIRFCQSCKQYRCV